jgi:NAD(P)-dependent dehydrogenase (short-subunit alcohol dehydrogenase family)
MSARRALVTGGMRGIGASVVTRLREDGLEVETLDLLDGADHQLDLAGEAPLPDFGAVDVLVSSAAITTTIAPAHRMSDEQWQRDIAVNLTGAYRVARACLPGMRERGWGRIVVVSSVAAIRGLPGQVAYSASKAGLLGMIKTVAAENAGHGVTANAVLPGVIETEMVAAMPAEILDGLRATAPAGRLGTPEEVADLIAYLASDRAGYVTGQDVAVAGGFELNATSLTRRR